MTKELESLIPDNPLECLKVLRTSANSYCSFNNDQCEYNKKLADNIEQALIKTNQYLGARRNGKTLEQMYQLVQYSKKPMKPSIWIARIDGKLEQRVIIEKEDYDKLQIKAQEQEKVLKVIFEKPKQSETAIVYIRATIRPSYEDYCLVIRDEYHLAEEEFDLLNKISKDIRGE